MALLLQGPAPWSIVGSPPVRLEGRTPWHWATLATLPIAILTAFPNACPKGGPLRLQLRLSDAPQFASGVSVSFRPSNRLVTGLRYHARLSPPEIGRKECVLCRPVSRTPSPCSP